jgi:hypothetical protein
MQDARRLAINSLDKEYNETRVLVDELAKTAKPGDNITLVKLKLDSLALYINALKTLDTPRLTGGKKTRRHRRK